MTKLLSPNLVLGARSLVSVDVISNRRLIPKIGMLGIHVNRRCKFLQNFHNMAVSIRWTSIMLLIR